GGPLGSKALFGNWPGDAESSGLVANPFALAAQFGPRDDPAKKYRAVVGPKQLGKRLKIVLGHPHVVGKQDKDFSPSRLLRVSAALGDGVDSSLCAIDRCGRAAKLLMQTELATSALLA